MKLMGQTYKIKTVIFSLSIWIIGGIIGYILLGICFTMGLQDNFIPLHASYVIFSKSALIGFLYFSIPFFLLSVFSILLLNIGTLNEEIILVRCISILLSFITTMISYCMFAKYLISYERFMASFGGIILAPIVGVFAGIFGYFLGYVLVKLYRKEVA